MKRKTYVFDRRAPWFTAGLYIAGMAAGLGADLIGLWEFNDPTNIGKATVGTDLVVRGTAPVHFGAIVDQEWKAEEGVILTAGGVGNDLKVANPVGANGNGTQFTNYYTLVFDVMSPRSSVGKWRALLQTQVENNNDGDYFISTGAQLGIRQLGYTPEIHDTVWNRIVLNFDVGNSVQVFMNGEFFWNHTGDAVMEEVDGRLALKDVFYLFADEDGENSPLYVSKVAYYKGNLTPEEIAAMGAAGTQLPIPPANLISSTGFELAEVPVGYPKAGGNVLPVPKPIPFPKDILYPGDGQDSLPIRPHNIFGTIQIRDLNNPFGTGQYLYMDGYVGNPNRAEYGTYVGDFGLTHYFPRVLPKHSSIRLDFYEPSTNDPNLKGPMSFGVAKDGDIGGGGSFISWVIQEGKISTGLDNVEQDIGPDLATMPALQLDHPYRMHIQLNVGNLPWETRGPGGASSVTIPGLGAALYVEDLADHSMIYYGTWKTKRPDLLPNTFCFKSFNTFQPGNALIIDNFMALDESVSGAGLWVGGADQNNLWSNPANWDAGVVPAQGSAVHFHADDNGIMENDLLEDTTYETLAFTMEGSFFQLMGNRLATTGGITLAANVLAQVDIDLRLLETMNVNVGENAALELNGVLSGLPSFVVEGNRMGTVVLGGPSQLGGPIIVNQGILEVYGDHTASTAGWLIGQRGGLDAEPCDVQFGTYGDPAQILVAANKQIQLGNPGGGGVGRILDVNADSEVVNNGALVIGHDGRLHLRDESSWTQNGRMEIHGIWGYGAAMEIHDDAVFTYAGSSMIEIYSGSNEYGRGRMVIDGGTLVTSQGFAYKTDWNGEVLKAKLGLGNATVRLTKNIPAFNPPGSNGSRVHVVLEGDATIDTDIYSTTMVLSEMLISPGQDVEEMVGPGPGSLFKQGTGTLTIDSVPQYIGDTIVEQGTLVLNQMGLDDESAVIVEAGAQLRLNFSGVDKVASLTIDGVEYEPGVYGADDPSGAITGSGQIEVAAVLQGFDGWAAFYGLSGDPNADFDNDGMSDALEYALAGQDPTVPGGFPGVLDGGTLSFQKNPEAVANGDVSYEIQISDDLTGWDAAPEMMILENDESISITIPEEGAPERIFVRLSVTLVP